MTIPKFGKQTILELKAVRGALEKENVELNQRIASDTKKKEANTILISNLGGAIFGVEMMGLRIK